MQEKIMQQMRENLDILFRRVAPEVVLESLRLLDNPMGKGYSLPAISGDYGLPAYRHYADQNLADYSPDEIDIRFRELEKELQSSLFFPLVNYGNVVLEMEQYFPVCKLEEILNWNTTALRIGQDLVVTAWLAEQHVSESHTASKKHLFIWPAVLKTNDRALEKIFERGLAENHSHLHGATQSFALSWACLMNHPECIQRFLAPEERFKENLTSGIMKGVLDLQMEWKERLLYAAMIRALLFERCLGDDSAKIKSEFKEFDCFPRTHCVKKKVAFLRYTYGSKFKQKKGNRRCLDYANCEWLYCVQEDHHNRLLAGERSLLYHCFLLHFRGELNDWESTLLYLYILMKSHFRSELIQSNGKTGFQNFLEYQDRKNQFFESFSEYWTEAFRLSICMAQKENHTAYYEARVMPKKTPQSLRKTLDDIDNRVRLAFEPEEEKLRHYYVIHFAKEKYRISKAEEKGILWVPRNIKSRQAAETGARALCKYIQLYDALRYDSTKERVLGIDACSSEIGCRPETFATEFRFLREESRKRRIRIWNRGDGRAPLGVTYHAGEDFLDIIDGLRAIDEAMFFLQMRRGERLGHALALGIAPEEYYQFKKWNIYMTKQDWLDNLVWILFRSLELKVEIKANHRAEMRMEAHNLLYEIYRLEDRKLGNSYGDLLEVYYDAWKLRGDHPSLYKSGGFNDRAILSTDDYNKYKVRDDNLDFIRKNSLSSYIYHLYHYDYEVKKRGWEPIGHGIEEWYIELVCQFQFALQKEVHKRGMAIECNPTSNVLIGTFKYYDKHPIMTFNDHHLGDKPENPHIQVSINTDDIGVFDTSLENEYALVFEAIRRSRHAEGNYNDDDIYEYLEYIRENGWRMAFKR